MTRLPSATKKVGDISSRNIHFCVNGGIHIYNHPDGTQHGPAYAQVPQTDSSSIHADGTDNGQEVDPSATAERTSGTDYSSSQRIDGTEGDTSRVVEKIEKRRHPSARLAPGPVLYSMINHPFHTYRNSATRKGRTEVRSSQAQRSALFQLSLSHSFAQRA